MEEVAKLSLEEFLEDEAALERALRGIRGCLSVVECEAERVAGRLGLKVGGDPLGLFWELARERVVSANLVEDLEDVYAVASGSRDRVTVYSALIRSMEVVEAVRSSLRKVLE